MRITRVELRNIRSAKDLVLDLDPRCNILIGPNGGGKSNFLETIHILLRRHFVSTFNWGRHDDTEEPAYQPRFGRSDDLPKFFDDDAPQSAVLKLEVDKHDLRQMRAIVDRGALTETERPKTYANGFVPPAPASWDLDKISVGQSFEYRVEGMVLQQVSSSAAQHYLQYLNCVELYALHDRRSNLGEIVLPYFYLPPLRSYAAGAQRVQLTSGDDKVHNLANLKQRSGSSFQDLAIHILAAKRRTLERAASHTAWGDAWDSDHDVRMLKGLFRELGWDWRLDCINEFSNQYEFGASELSTGRPLLQPSSGEGAMLELVFSQFIMGVGGATVLIDEPELHLHPTWQQRTLERLLNHTVESDTQVIVATHSPSLVTPSTIAHVVRLAKGLHGETSAARPRQFAEAAPLLRMINASNNERIFFANRVVLVEGTSDKLVFEALVSFVRNAMGLREDIAVIAVDGKDEFGPYSSLLEEFAVPYSIITDLDYLITHGNLPQLGEVRDKKVEGALTAKKSVDRDRLLPLLRSALDSADVEELAESKKKMQQVLTALEERKRGVRTDLSLTEKGLRDARIQELACTNVYVLKRGEIESYLPQGIRSIKNILSFVAGEEFRSWLLAARISAERKELIEIAVSVCGCSVPFRSAVRALRRAQAQGPA